MKEILMPLAHYNSSANKAASAILEQLPEDLLILETGTYYRTLPGILGHIAQGEFAWLKRFAEFSNLPLLREDAALSEDPAAVKARIGGDIHGTISFLKAMDERLTAFIGAISEEALGGRIRYRNMRGEELEKTCWHTVFHVLNHGTHHRGEISAVLDQNGIANDFSGFTLYTT